MGVGAWKEHGQKMGYWKFFEGEQNKATCLCGKPVSCSKDKEMSDGLIRQLEREKEELVEALREINLHAQVNHTNGTIHMYTSALLAKHSSNSHPNQT